MKTYILAAFLVALIGCLAAIFRYVPKDHGRSISNHAASSRPTYWLFSSALMLTGLPVLYLFWQWLVPSLQLPDWFGLVLLVGLVCLALTAYIPDTPGWKHRAHGMVAYGLALWMLSVMALVYGMGHLTTVSRLAVLQFVVTGVLFLVLVFTSAWARRYYLYFQSYVVINWLTVLVLISL